MINIGRGVTVYLGGLARASLTHNHHHLVLPDHLQQLVAAVKDRQEAALLLQSPAFGPVTDRLPRQLRQSVSLQSKVVLA